MIKKKGKETRFNTNKYWGKPIPVAERSKAWVCSGIAGSNPAGDMDFFVASVACCQVEVSATGRSLVQRSPTTCGVSLCVIK